MAGFVKEVFFNTDGDRWEYNIYTPDGTKCVYQDYDPSICGAHPMTEERANEAADAVLADLTASQ